MIPVQTSDLTWAAVQDDDASVRWAGGYATYGGSGSTFSSTVYFEIGPGGRLGWHTDSTKETQVIIAGSGKIQRDDGNNAVTVSDVFVLPEGFVTTSSTMARNY
jgi:quercetin dioxygenase-like cupin family protein